MAVRATPWDWKRRQDAAAPAPAPKSAERPLPTLHADDEAAFKVGSLEDVEAWVRVPIGSGPETTLEGPVPLRLALFRMARIARSLTGEDSRPLVVIDPRDGIAWVTEAEKKAHGGKAKRP